jgi:3-dehydroquinate synthase
VLVDSNDVGLRLPTGHQLCQPELLWQTLQEIVQHRDGLQRMPLPVGAGVATFVNDVQLSEISDAARMLAVGDFR